MKPIPYPKIDPEIRELIRAMNDTGFIETPIEDVYREQYLRELAGRGWLPRWLGAKFGQKEEPE